MNKLIGSERSNTIDLDTKPHSQACRLREMIMLVRGGESIQHGVGVMVVWSKRRSAYASLGNERRLVRPQSATPAHEPVGSNSRVGLCDVLRRPRSVEHVELCSLAYRHLLVALKQHK